MDTIAGQTNDTWLIVLVVVLAFLQFLFLIFGLFTYSFLKRSGLVKGLLGFIGKIFGEIFSKIYQKVIESPIVNMLGYAYDRDQDIFYSTVNAWQRKYGYCSVYDETAPLSGMIVDSEPVYFDYDNKKWLIEFWKGQYDLVTGFEIGVYNTTGPDLNIHGVFNGTFYESAKNDEMLEMSCKLYKNNDLLFEREQRHWWLTGFKVGEFSNPDELKADISITFPNRIMMNAFAGGLLDAGYSYHEFSEQGNTLRLVYAKPHTKQPATRTAQVEEITQWKNKLLCDTFNELTGKGKTAPGKILSLKVKDADLYKSLKEFGRPMKQYDIYRKIRAYIN